jgi:hypothetical protein
MKNLITAVLVSASLVMASPVVAEDTTNCVQVTQYGGGVGIVCGAKHEPKDTGLADISPVLLASIFFSMAGFTLAKYKKLVRSEVGL